MTTATANITPKERVQSSDGKYLSFNLAQESYGVAVLKVREIIRLQEITPLPKAPHFIKGIINLRGKIIPVIDLSLRFGMAPIEQDEHTCIIVVQIRKSNGEEKFVGLLVEAVQEVVQINADDIEPPPDFGSGIQLDYLQGMSKSKNGVCTLLNVEAIVNTSI